MKKNKALSGILALLMLSLASCNGKQPTGTVLLKDGKCPISVWKTARGSFLQL
jgi:hypothetical protein